MFQVDCFCLGTVFVHVFVVVPKVFVLLCSTCDIKPHQGSCVPACAEYFPCVAKLLELKQGQP